MGRQILRLVVLLMLLHIAFGIICYECETRNQIGIEPDKTADVIEGEGGAADAGGGGGGSVGAGGGNPSGVTKKTEGQTLRGENKTKVKVPGCDKDKKKWIQEECGRSYPACYTLIGQVAERDEVANVLLDVTRRGCFSPDLGGVFANSTYKQNYTSKGESKKDTVTSKQGELSGTAELTVCDNLNNGDMLCNQGIRARMVNGMFKVFLVSASIFLLHFQLGRII